MDAVITAATSALPQLGAGGLAVYLLLLILRREGSTLDRERAAHEAVLTRERKAHDAELVEKEAEIERLRARVSTLDTLLDQERAARRAAEDARGPAPGRSPWSG